MSSQHFFRHLSYLSISPFFRLASWRGRRSKKRRKRRAARYAFDEEAKKLLETNTNLTQILMTDLGLTVEFHSTASSLGIAYFEDFLK